MNRSPLAQVRLVLILVISSLVALGSSLVQAEGDRGVSPLPPLLVSASVAARTPGVVIVTGRGFTAGSDVYVAFYDAWGRQRYETRWVVASQAVYGPNGSQDPANGFSPGGIIRETFGAQEAIYGPNGSQDPANGYVRQGSRFSSMCDTTVMVRAFDEQQNTWSNILDVDAGCTKTSDPWSAPPERTLPGKGPY